MDVLSVLIIIVSIYFVSIGFLEFVCGSARYMRMIGFIKMMATTIILIYLDKVLNK